MEYEKWLFEWIENYVKPAVKQRTYGKYKKLVSIHIVPSLGGYALADLSATVLQTFTARLSERLAPNTVNGILSVLKNSLKKAVMLDLCEKHYADSICRPKAREKKIECFSPGEQRKIERYVQGKSNPKLFGILLCLYSGLRIGELLALTWSDIDLSKGLMCVTKTCRDSWANGRYVKIIDTPKTACSQRLIPIPKQLLPQIRHMKKCSAHDYVVAGKTNQGTQVRSYQKTFEKLLRTLHLPHKGFHALRHTFATRALECGMDVRTLSEILGHKNPTVTLKRYAHSMLEHKVKMMNKVGKLLL